MAGRVNLLFPAAQPIFGSPPEPNQMRIITLIFTIILLLQEIPCFADTFTVTNNADSGPGTLREAITKANANGDALADYIYFNIADISEAGRTITLHNDLPALTSNIVLDAGTQPGNTFGVSGARISLKHDGLTNFYHALILDNCHSIEIYGIYFSGFNRYGAGIDFPIAIYVKGLVQDVKIGAPGKGNAFYDNSYNIANSYWYGRNPGGERFKNVELKSNFFGLSPDGLLPDDYGRQGIFIRSFSNIDIGGETPEEGNYFGGFEPASAWFVADSTLNNGTVNLINNTFGSVFTKTSAIKCGIFRVSGDNNASGSSDADVIVNVRKNTFNNPYFNLSNWCHGLLVIDNIHGFITIRGNQFGNLFPWISCQTSAISVSNCENGIIGGPDPEDQNIIKASDMGIVSVNNRNVTIQKNQIYCNSIGITANSTKTLIPRVDMFTTNNVDQVAGKATPNCKIEVFRTQACASCNNGETLMGETMSDQNGDWSFNGAFSSAVTARATTASGATGEFSKPEFLNKSVIKYPNCGKTNGSITGMEFVSGTRYYWTNSNNLDTVFHEDITNIGSGIYTFVVEQTRYCKVTYQVYIGNESPQIDERYVTITQPSCGKPNGRIADLYPSGPYHEKYWLNEARDTIGRDNYITDLPPGKYKLIILNTEGGCGDSTDYFVLTNISGPSVDQSATAINPAKCSGANGSITGLSYTGTIGNVYMEWRNEQNEIVGNSINLINQPAGKYRFKLKDEGNCDTVITNYFNIPSVGLITIDESNRMIQPAGCTKNNGSITGLNVSGADLYKWTDVSSQNVVGNTVDITGLPVGNYQLTATNAAGCELKSPVINIPPASFSDIEPIHASVFDGNCGENNGWLRLEGFTNEAALQSYYWINSNTGQQLGTSLSLTGLGAGTYEFIATDTNGCQATIFRAVLIVNSKPIINTSGIIIQPDQCDLKKGSITGIVVNGLVGPTSYQWTNTANMTIGHQADLLNIGAGNYQLSITDNQTCVLRAGPFIVANDNNAGITPQYDNTTIAKYSAATLTVKNLQPGTYSLYNDAAGTQLLLQNNTGQFTTPVLSEDRVFYIRHQSGSCSSPLVPVRITVVDKSFFAIPRAFTPNGDGLNDRLILQVIGYIEVNYFKVYNRNGEEVFSTKSIGQSWDGRWKGQLQPGGAYVWMAQGKDINGKTIQDKGSFILIR